MENRSFLYQNRDQRLKYAVGIRIGPKSMIEIERLGIQIVEDSIRKP